MSKKSKVTIAVTLLASSVYLSGCGLLGGDKVEKMDPPKKVTSLKSGESIKEDGSKKAGAVSKKDAILTELYLIDENGYVVSQTLPLPNSKSVAKQALEYLVADGPGQNIIPNGFRAVLPANTDVDVDIKDGTAIVDFSKEFKSYDKKDEQKILQSITWTLTQFDSIDKVKLQVNGYPLGEMPVNGTPISSDGLSRADGINAETAGVVDITNTHPLTVYYIAQNSDDFYYVPVTKRVSNTEKNNVKAVVNELIKGPGNNSLVSGFVSDVALLDEPKVEDGKVTLNFNENILSFDEKVVPDEILNALVYSLTEQKGIKSVAVEVKGSTELVNEQGEPLTEPVTRPEKVNTGSF